ncbi:MAG: hypothetical protein IBX61_09605 [Thermoleophilia bacterium]|nr:hypothetical protein [Thermoleophilia bacterium]
MAKTRWFHNTKSGQTFEVEVGSIWEKEAELRGYDEVSAPTGESKKEPEAGAAKGGKEKK